MAQAVGSFICRFILRGGTVLSIIFCLAGCAGYHLRQNDNPFQEHKIHTVAVPLAINHTSLPLLGVYITDKISEVLRSYSKLYVLAGENRQADAILIMEITAPQRAHDFFQNDQHIYTDRDYKAALGSRSSFYVASDVHYTVQVRFILLRLNGEDALLPLAKLAEKATAALAPSSIIFDQTLSLTGSVAQQAASDMQVNGAGELNMVRNKALLELSQQQLAERAARDFQQLVLDVF